MRVRYKYARSLLFVNMTQLPYPNDLETQIQKLDLGLNMIESLNKYGIITYCQITYGWDKDK
ncbi:hypothetical protein FRX31_027618 [Thalictrum thalictroides]|uniref:Uncharacterized protein n=1 Tax=Thalictrum thalictroides TaxID=46969 RepID=A0A7J6VDV6_THATH|nr:hypothetical protein FRX31_027618 [Thalictrum thalictroides]